jgi:hypothetical protein
MTLLHTQAQLVLDQAIRSQNGKLIKIHCTKDIIQPSRRGREILYHFKRKMPDYQFLRIEIMSDDELWLIPTSNTLEDL